MKPKPRAKKPGSARTPTARPAVKRRQAARVDPVETPPDFPWPLRPHQAAAVRAFDAGKRRQLLVWHRRAGKDITGLSLARRESMRHIGAYAHFFPAHSQARRALWNGVDPGRGESFLDAAFGDITHKKNSTEMLVEFNNGSTWQLLGSDNYNRIVGGNWRGVVFSEWALCDPRAWDFIRPIILENKGWALFITTLRGRNHAYQMMTSLADDPEWYVDIRTVDDTTNCDGTPIITRAQVEGEITQGMSRALVQQEFYCDPAASVPGAVYSIAATRLLENTQRQAATWNPLAPVYAAWNLSQTPALNSVIFAQPGTVPRILGAQSIPNATFAECLALTRTRRWKVTDHLIAEDDIGMLEPMAELRVFPEVIRQRVPGGTEITTQAVIEKMSIDAGECPDLLDALIGYTRANISDDEFRPVFSDGYENTWHRQLACALETFALYERDYASDGGWSRPQSYAQTDRRII